jgi:hypothetical protein
MTINLMRGKSRKPTVSDAKISPPDLAIGETDARVFDCPSCARPLSNGTTRCPGCGVRLIMGIRVVRAGGILALGIAIGVLIGGAAMAAAIGITLHDATSPPAAVGAATGAAGADTTIASPPPAALGTGPAAPLGAPQTAISALSGTAVVDGRIVVDATTLDAVLADPKASGIELVRAIRSLSADAALGIDQAGRLGPWRDAAPVMAQLDTFYRAMAQTSRLALQASVDDAGAYRRSAAQMKTVLAGLAGVDAASRTLAATVDLELPPVDLAR